MIGRRLWMETVSAAAAAAGGAAPESDDESDEQFEQPDTDDVANNFELAIAARQA